MVMRLLKWLFVLFVVVLIAAFVFGPAQVEKQMNIVESHEQYVISDAAKQLHASLVIGDWHADSALWNRNLSQRSSIGHVDIPRLQEGNVALQMFTTVTKSPSGLNYERNETEAWDDITTLAMLQRWPLGSWKSLTARALHQADKVKLLAEQNPDNFRLIKSQSDLAKFFTARKTNKGLVGGLIGTEGSHALDGKIENIQVLFDNGFRMMSLQHFFDNKLGGSLHGTSGAGLSEFGRQAVQKMQELNIIIDVSHSSPQVVEDVLALSEKPLVVSHTGLQGSCDSPRNIDDGLMIEIARRGGLIAIGYWEGAICGTSPTQIAETMNYGIQLVGARHIALGSDFDGSVATAIDTSELSAITQALLNLDVSEADIRLVMGANMQRFLAENLPL